MISHETASIKPEAKKVNVAARQDKAGRAQIRVAEEARAARTRTSCAIPEAAQLTLLALVAAFVFPPGGEDDPGPRLGRSSPLNRNPHGDCQMNLRKKYGPAFPCDDDIYMAIFDEAMERIITSEVEPSSIELALYVISRLGLDPKDLEPVEELAAIQLATAKNPQTIAGYLAKKARRGATASTRWWGPRH